MSNITHLIIGLGNPGPEYADTRHNIGFKALDAIADKYGAAPWKKKFRGEMTMLPSGECLLLKPLTFMNLSGEAVGEAMRFYKVPLENIIVFQDEIDLQAGSVRIKKGGGSGGHNGIKSLDAHIGPDYWRVRLGVGHPGEKGEAVTNHVLGAFAKADRTWLEVLLKALAGEFNLVLENKMQDYQQRVLAALGPLAPKGE